MPDGQSQLKAARPLQFSLRFAALRCDKPGSSARRLRRARARALTCLPPPRLPPSSLTSIKATMTIDQHIEELRAEARNAETVEGRRAIEAELELALAEREVIWAELDGRIDGEPPF
ncbi:hypothetical protein RGCCGE502_32232 (plasmid) [Rhizobium grahamii CCGE 502]|uniref:Uncharacterized protein n=2 Tax=Rhizobium grahamii TaxID=1120045 RepID=S3I2V1_9HYPH|nr:hypothetical protein RGCCGE502_32232 [Rhizobium grahamii CCGE 502]